MLYRVVRENLRSFEAFVRRNYRRPLPKYVLDEFKAYLRCGIPAYGFVRVGCPTCGTRRIVAFSCKARGICPSCSGRRMSDTAARLVDTVLPDVPYRQWVLSLPYELRLLAASKPDVLNAAVRIFARAVFRSNRRRARRPRAPCGGITFIQRFGGSLNLNPHLHDVVADGIFERHPSGEVGFRRARAPRREEILEVAAEVRRGMLRYLRRKGYLTDDACDGGRYDEDSATARPLQACRQLALRGGDLQAVRDEDGLAPDEDAAFAGRGGRWSAGVDGFDVHAGVVIAAGDHEGRERLCRYATRPPFSMDRFTELPDGRIAYRVRHPLGPEATHRIMTPLELMARLAALVPPPRHPLVRYHGVFAPHSRWRASIVPQAPAGEYRCRHRDGAWEEKPKEEAAPSPAGGGLPGAAGTPAAGDLPELLRPTLSDDHWKRVGEGEMLARQPRVDWAVLLRRTFAIDVLRCPACGGRLGSWELVEDQAEARRILASEGLPSEPPEIAPAGDPEDWARGPPSWSGDPGRVAGQAAPADVDECVQPFPEDDGSQVGPDDSEW